MNDTCSQCGKHLFLVTENDLKDEEDSCLQCSYNEQFPDEEEFESP